MGEHVLVKNILTNGLNMDLLLWARVQKTVYGVETQWLSGKENDLSAEVSKIGQADSFPSPLIFSKKVQL